MLAITFAFLAGLDCWLSSVDNCEPDVVGSGCCGSSGSIARDTGKDTCSLLY